MSVRRSRSADSLPWTEASGLLGEYHYNVIYGSSRKSKRLAFNFKTKRDATKAARLVGGRVVMMSGSLSPSDWFSKKRKSRHGRTR